MGKLKRMLPFILVGLAVFLLVVALLVGSQQNIAPDTPSLAEILDIDTPVTSQTDGALDQASIDNVASQDQIDSELEEEGFNWWDILSAQWRYYETTGEEMRINLTQGFFRTQSNPPDTSMSRSGVWTVMCPNRELGWRYFCQGMPGERVDILIELGAVNHPPAYEEYLQLTYIDANTLEGRYKNEDSTGETFLLTKVVY